MKEIDDSMWLMYGGIDMEIEKQSFKGDGYFLIRPVGRVKATQKEPRLRPGLYDLEYQAETRSNSRDVESNRSSISEIIIDKELEDLLEGIEEFSHILVLYWAHKIPENKRSLSKVHPMGRKDLPLVGIFATCSPVRPNPILVTAVRLLDRQGNILKVKGLDAIDETPVLDLKPYNPRFFKVEDLILSPWMDKIMNEENRSKGF